MRIPFAFDPKDGVVNVRGTVRLDGDDLVFDMSQSLMSLVPVGRRTVRLPADDVESIDVQTTRMGKARLVVRPFGFVTVRGFPGDPLGEIVLPLQKADRAAAEAFAREVRLRNLPR
ncbi:MAG TPA: hypothetical protein VF594_02095 [Rubricoccaceae bacterium]|jgi:hypothetical protein